MPEGMNAGESMDEYQTNGIAYRKAHACRVLFLKFQ